jgi:hypothetical protein
MHRSEKAMANDETGRLLNEIGNILARDTEYPLDGTFLYAEAKRMSVSIDIFKDLGDRLLYRWPMPGLSDAILDLWEAAPQNKRWSAMQYRIHDGTFEATFTYPEDFDEAEDVFVRRDRILQQRYGNKRIVYPLI